MRLHSFRVKNYRSILDSKEVSLSDQDNVTVLAGQNESGKSSILGALYAFENNEFEADSLPFTIDSVPTQSVSCTYKIEDEDLSQLIIDTISENSENIIASGKVILDQTKINEIKEFTLTRIKEGDEIRLEIDSRSFNLFRAGVTNKPIETPVEGSDTTTTSIQYYGEDDNEAVSDLFWQITPHIVFFDDFCDLLPDSISIASLSASDTKTNGYHAVRNLENILGINLVDKDKEADPVRRTKEQKDNDSLSIDFQKDWGQRIHGENKVVIKYNFEKRNGAGVEGSYVNFFVETKEGQPLPPKQRSKGLIWFLSLWLELKAQDISYNDLVLLLDEPDQHLHVRAQKDILNLINKLASGDDSRKGDQVIYSTHSPYLIEVERLSRIKLILNSEKSGTQVEDVSTTKINTEYKRDALQPIADAIGLSVSEFSTLNKKNVLLEGISDFYYFMAMRKLMGKQTNFHFVPGIGVRQINNLISLCIGYGLEWGVVIDSDPSTGGKDSKKKFDEIKDYIFDGDETRTKNKVYVLDGIVGIENMFIVDDFKLVDSQLGKGSDMVKVVGRSRKALFSKMFYEKVEAEEIILTQISQKAKDNFEKAFAFIDHVFSNVQ